MSAGIIYVATGNRFVKEARVSAASCKGHMPGIPVVLFTDEPQSSGSEFDDVQIIEEVTRSFADKIAPLLKAPFDKNLFLDTDTFMCRPVTDVFQMLDQYDVVAAHAPMRVTWPQNEVPDAFPEINSGVLAWRKNEKTEALFRDWKHLYQEHLSTTGQKDDQPSLRLALYRSDVRLGILPPEYNYRTVLPGFAGRGAIRILHGRHTNPSSVEKILNRDTGCRVFLPGDAEFVPERFKLLAGTARYFVTPLSMFYAAAATLRARLTTWKRRLTP